MNEKEVCELVRSAVKVGGIKILSCLSEGRGIMYFTSKEIIDKTDIPQATVYRRLNELEETGLVESQGTNAANRAREYSITDKGRKVLKTIENLSEKLEGGEE